MSNSDYDSMQSLVDDALTEMKVESGGHFSYAHVNLAELQRRTGISRAKLRRWKDNGFTFLPHANRGRKAEQTVLTGYTDQLDSLLQQGVSNASLCLERLQEVGYQMDLGFVNVHDHMGKNFTAACIMWNSFPMPNRKISLLVCYTPSAIWMFLSMC